MAYKLRGVGRTFRTREQALSFLRSSPGYVRRRRGYLESFWPGLLAEATPVTGLERQRLEQRSAKLRGVKPGRNVFDLVDVEDVTRPIAKAVIGQVPGLRVVDPAIKAGAGEIAQRDRTGKVGKVAGRVQQAGLAGAAETVLERGLGGLAVGVTNLEKLPGDVKQIATGLGVLAVQAGIASYGDLQDAVTKGDLDFSRSRTLGAQIVKATISDYRARYGKDWRKYAAEDPLFYWLDALAAAGAATRGATIAAKIRKGANPATAVRMAFRPQTGTLREGNLVTYPVLSRNAAVAAGERGVQGFLQGAERRDLDSVGGLVQRQVQRVKNAGAFYRAQRVGKEAAAAQRTSDAVGRSAATALRRIGTRLTLPQQVALRVVQEQAPLDEVIASVRQWASEAKTPKQRVALTKMGGLRESAAEYLTEVDGVPMLRSDFRRPVPGLQRGRLGVNAETLAEVSRMVEEVAGDLPGGRERILFDMGVLTPEQIAFRKSAPGRVHLGARWIDDRELARQVEGQMGVDFARSDLTATGPDVPIERPRTISEAKAKLDALDAKVAKVLRPVVDEMFPPAARQAEQALRNVRPKGKRAQAAVSARLEVEGVGGSSRSVMADATAAVEARILELAANPDAHPTIVRLAQWIEERDQLRGAIGENFLSELEGMAPGARLGLDEVYASAERAQPRFQELVDRAAGAAGARAIHADLKSRDVAARKVQGDYGGDASRLRDVLRGTIVVEDAAQLRGVLAQLRPRVVDSTNYLRRQARAPGGYSFLKLTVRVDDHLAEVQVATPEMLMAKKAGHELYARARELPVDDPRAAALWSEMQQLYDAAYEAAEARLRASNSSAVTRPPSQNAGAQGKGLGSGVSQARQRAEGVPSSPSNETGIPSTSKNIASLGAVADEFSLPTGQRVAQVRAPFGTITETRAAPPASLVTSEAPGRSGLVGAEEFTGGLSRIPDVPKWKLEPAAAQRAKLETGAVPAAPGSVRHPYTGALRRSGNLREDTTKLVAESAREAQRWGEAQATHDLAVLAGNPVRFEGSAPIKLRALNPAESVQLKTVLAEAQRASESGVRMSKAEKQRYADAVARWKTELFPEETELAHVPVGESVPGVVWVPKTMLRQMNAPIKRLIIPGRGLRAFDDLLSTMRFGILLAKGTGYVIPQVAGNLFMNLVQQGGKAFLNTVARAPLMTRRYGVKASAAVDEIMGQGATRSLLEGLDRRGAGTATRIVSWVGERLNVVSDMAFRRSAFEYEARRMGFAGREGMERLLFDAANREQLTEAANRARGYIGDFERLGPVERDVVRRGIFVYPWLKVATRYGIKLLVEHPVASNVAASQAEGALRPAPGYASELVPVGGSGERPYAINTAGANPISTFAQIAETAAGTIGGDYPSFGSLGGYLNPALEAAAQGAFGRNLATGQPARAGLPGIGTALVQQTAPAALVKRLREADEDLSRKTFPYSQTEALAQYLGGSIAPRPVNRDVLAERAQQEDDADLTSPQRARRKVFTERQEVFSEAKRLVGVSRLPVPLREAYNAKAAVAAARAQSRRKQPGGGEAYLRDVFVREARLAASRGAIPAALLREIEQNVPNAPASVVERNLRRFREQVWGDGLDVIREARRDLEERGAVLALG